MEPNDPGSSFIIRVRHSTKGQRILVHNLRSREVREFASWTTFLRYLRNAGPGRTLK